ncbi:MAG TPA: hypothetical protein VEQ59_25485 [Polyangiaceae bacterium]|nr:hypothetical protein [Polyangiaceae bacterium]
MRLIAGVIGGLVWVGCAATACTTPSRDFSGTAVAGGGGADDELSGARAGAGSALGGDGPQGGSSVTDGGSSGVSGSSSTVGGDSTVSGEAGAPSTPPTTSCQSWRVCNADQTEVKAGTATSDAVCADEICQKVSLTSLKGTPCTCANTGVTNGQLINDEPNLAKTYFCRQL